MGNDITPDQKQSTVQQNKHTAYSIEVLLFMTLKCTCAIERILQLQFHALEVEERELLLAAQGFRLLQLHVLTSAMLQQNSKWTVAS